MSASSRTAVIALCCLLPAGCIPPMQSNDSSDEGTSTEAVGESGTTPNATVDPTASGGPDASPQATQPAEPILPVAEGDEPAFSGTTDELWSAFTADGDAFKSEYDRSVVQLSGEAAHFRNDDDAAFISIEADNGVIECQTVDPQPWLALGPGQPVTVLGRCVVTEDDPARISLAHVIIIEVGEHFQVIHKSQELMFRFAADPEAMTDFYTGKSIIVEGLVVARSPRDLTSGGVYADLNGHNDVHVCCSLDPGMKEGVKYQQMARVLGRVGEYQPDGLGLMLEDCIVLPID